MSVTVRHLSVALAGKTILHNLNVEFPSYSLLQFSLGIIP